MRDHGAPTILLGEEVSLNGLSDGTNLIHLQEQAVASLLVHSHLDAFGVGDRQVITHNLLTQQNDFKVSEENVAHVLHMLQTHST